MTFPTQDHIEAAQQAADYWKTKVGLYVWPSVALAQTCIESANGKAISGKNNFGGIKANPAQIAAGQYRTCMTQEFVNGRYVRVPQKFASYETLKDYYIAHGRILTLPIYRAAWRDTDADSFLAHIAPHYATEPRYTAIVRGAMMHLDLYRYDDPIGAAPPPVKPVERADVAKAGAGVLIGAPIVVKGWDAVADHLPSVGLPALGAVAVAAAIGGFIWWAARSDASHAHKQLLAQPPISPEELADILDGSSGDPPAAPQVSVRVTRAQALTPEPAAPQPQAGG